jgi:hypothetical protein
MTVLIAVISAVGLTVTVNVNGVPWQPPRSALGVTIYVAVCCVFNVFLILPNTCVWLVPLSPPVNVAVYVGIPQLYFVSVVTISLPPNVTAGDTSNGYPLHTTVLNTPISGVGLTVTSTVNVAP